ncbi:hypothetical protein ACQPT2_17690 [Erwinia amylovora]
MQRTRLEKLTEILIGEAVLHLLDNKLSVNGATLAHRLKEMLASETKSERFDALKVAIDEIQYRFSSAYASQPFNEAENSYSGKKH